MSYLFPFIHLYLHAMTHMVIEGREVLIERKPLHPVWKVSTPILQGRGEFPKEIHPCLKLVQALQRHRQGMLEVDAVVGTIHWTQEIHPLNFGKEFPRFLENAQGWAEILTQELVRSEHRS